MYKIKVNVFITFAVTLRASQHQLLLSKLSWSSVLPIGGWGHAAGGCPAHVVQLLVHHLSVLLHLHSHLLFHGLLLLLRGYPWGMPLIYSCGECRLVASLRGWGPAGARRRVVPSGQVHLPHRLSLQCICTVTAVGHAHGVRGALRGGGHWWSLPHPHA